MQTYSNWKLASKELFKDSCKRAGFNRLLGTRNRSPKCRLKKRRKAVRRTSCFYFVYFWRFKSHNCWFFYWWQVIFGKSYSFISSCEVYQFTLFSPVVPYMPFQVLSFTSNLLKSRFIINKTLDMINDSFYFSPVNSKSLEFFFLWIFTPSGRILEFHILSRFSHFADSLT